MKTYRTGPVGALMDEYERATGELIAVLESISEAEYDLVRDTETKDDDCRSIRTIIIHVVNSGFGYAGRYRDVWGVERVAFVREPIAHADAPARLRAMLDYMVETLDGHWNLSDEDSMAMEIRAGWGPLFDFEQWFEHAIVHVLRHRRQIERFLGR